MLLFLFLLLLLQFKYALLGLLNLLAAVTNELRTYQIT